MKFNKIDKAIDRLLMSKGDISYHIDDLEIKKTINDFKYKVEKNFGFFIILALILLIINSFYSTVILIILGIIYLFCITYLLTSAISYLEKNKITNYSSPNSKIFTTIIDPVFTIIFFSIIIPLALSTELFYKITQHFYLIEEDIDINGIKHARKINYIGTESYYLNGKLNREDGLPAYIKDNIYIYYLNGKEIHREENVRRHPKYYQEGMIKKIKIASKLDSF